MRNFPIYLLSLVVLVGGCIVKYTPPVTPSPNPPGPVQPTIKSSANEAVRLYCLKASQVFADAAVMFKKDKNVQAVHDYLQQNLAKGRSDSFKGMDNRLEEILGAEKPDIDKGVQILEKISQEFKEAAK